MKVKREREVAQSPLTLSEPMDCSPPGSSVTAEVAEKQGDPEAWHSVGMFLKVNQERGVGSESSGLGEQRGGVGGL